MMIKSTFIISRGAILIGSFLFIYILSFTNVVQRAELSVYDLLTRFSSATEEIDEIVIVEIDKKTMDALGFPVPHNFLALALNALDNLGAKVVNPEIFVLNPGDELFSQEIVSL